MSNLELVAEFFNSIAIDVDVTSPIWDEEDADVTIVDFHGDTEGHIH